jgi:PEP-CTERM motif
MKKLMLAAVAVLLGSSAAHADILTFDGNSCTSNGTDVVSCGNGARFSQGFGDTANIDVQTRADGSTAVTPLGGMFYWGSQYSGLTGVGYGLAGGMPSIFLQPLSSGTVTLNSFQLGAWPDFTRNSQFSIFDGLGNVLFSSGPITVQGSTPSLFTGSWSSTTGIGISFGPDGYNVGIDNIDYSFASAAAVPEPATWLMMLLGFGVIGTSVRSKRKKLREAAVVT